MLKRGIIFLSVLFFLFMGLSRFLGIGEGGVESVTSLALYPFLIAQQTVLKPFTLLKERWHSPAALIQDLVHATRERERLQQEVIRLSALLNFQEMSKEVRDFMGRYTNSPVQIAHILLKNFNGSHFFLVDAGSKQGIEKDMIALYKDCLLGRVVEVYPLYSKVLLLTDKGCKVAAFCASTNAQGIAEGFTIPHSLRLNYVNHLDTVKLDDIVLSSGEGLVYPRGFGLGRVTQCEHDGLHHTITLTPLIDFNKIDYCCLVKNSITLNHPEPQEANP